MMNVFVAADNIISPLGSDSKSNFERLLKGESGISRQPEGYFAAAIPGNQFKQEGYTKFEQLLISSIAEALSQTKISLQDKRTAFIVSTTKGNIALMEQGQTAQLQPMQLYATADKIGTYFSAINKPVVISNACISGLLALLIAQRMIRSGQYDHAVVCGADELTQFVLSGFQSFQAVSDAPCKPFDANRKGITLGEGAATVILTKDTSLLPAGEVIRLGEGASSNDANHISGPSRTGEELSGAITKAIQQSGLLPEDIGFVSAHGTATLYNDEMEAKAFHLSGLQNVPVNSLKGYYGHTLGAAGLIEAIIGMHSMQAGVVIPTAGYESPGVSVPLILSNQLTQKPMLHYLKTTSGFGGCNAAMVFSKVKL
ncbi:beta-ketoacyl synthase [Chitinophaga sp. SYP-B3965]|uniref:beta-ketoacyl-[acyl-carrier-protein] synthase family protein n=1 Tax=Chitinophaga sp. SYP-B3965 TaxID=2663120 RepID=UPI00129972D6|nr:beta-ketoacyl synthase N-terminal-like domain-containing protein [Chitinophaga sp. SYP-B3965]MRG46048.1 beta-ketoacyl synthase [Chitinophaga sp. SYP-B3965]